MDIFQKKMDPCCAYCARGRALGAGQIACPRKGVMSAASSCRAFRYDPLKRVPPRPVKFNGSGLRDEDFQL